MGIMQKMDWIQDAQPLREDGLIALKSILIVAPHQDDESLGCGGAIAYLRQLGIPLHVVFVSDGSLSHPNSKQYPKPALVAVRESEAVDALSILGVNLADITFFQLPDSKLPFADTKGFESAVGQFTTLIERIKPDTIMMPWRRDPHPDHRATWQIANAAIQAINPRVRILEYFIWLWERAADTDLPLKGEMKVWEVNIEPFMALKKKAINAHISQTTNLINDDPFGFTLSAEVIAHFEKPVEIFVENL